MKIGIVSSSDGRGGAYACAFRLHQSLREAGVNVRMIVADKTRDDQDVIQTNPRWGRFFLGLRRHIDTVPVRVMYKRREHVPFHPAFLTNRGVVDALGGDFDVINPILIPKN